MKKKWKRRFAAFLVPPVLCLFLSGCWDKHELNQMFIVTGIALNKSDTPGMLDITLQTAKTDPGGSANSGGEKSQESATVLLESQRHTLSEAIDALNFNSSRKIFIHHNQVILLGMDLAKEGIADHLDLFIRDDESRMEVPVVIVDGDPKEALSVQMEQDKISAVFLSHILMAQNSISKFYQVRILDLASRMLDKSSSPIIPIIKVTDTEETKDISVTGMAIFKNDKFVGRLDNDQTLGYIWAMGNVLNSTVSGSCELGQASFIISELHTDRNVSVLEDGRVRVELDINAKLIVTELVGFTNISSQELTPHLVKMGQDDITKAIIDTFEIARTLDADIYEFGESVHRKFPNKWKSMEDQWDDVFSDIDLIVRVKATIPSTGKVGQSLEMKEEHDAG